MNNLVILAFVSIVVARPAEDIHDNKSERLSAGNEKENLKHFRRPINFTQRYRICPSGFPGGYQVYGPFGPGVIIAQGVAQGQGVGANTGNGAGSEQVSGAGVGQVIGINNGYVFGPNQYPKCKRGASSNCKEGDPIIPIGPGIIFKPEQVYGNGVNWAEYTQENIPSSGGSFDTNEGSWSGSGSIGGTPISENTSDQSGNGGGLLISGSIEGSLGFENIEVAPGSGSIEKPSGSGITIGSGIQTSQGSVSRPTIIGGQGTGTLCKRCSANQQSSKSYNPAFKATHDADLLKDESISTPIKDDGKKP